ncbi:MAG: hypothetical protein R3F59_22850 [Myxococcota bacterium]
MYPETPLPTLRPDPTRREARITTAQPYLWTPFLLDETSPTTEALAVPAEVPRVRGVVPRSRGRAAPGVARRTWSLEREDAGGWVP